MAAKKRTITRATRSSIPAEPLEGVVGLAEYHRDQAKNRMIAAMHKHLNLVSYACKEAGIARKTHYNWLKVDPDYREAIEEAADLCGDFVERKLYEAVQEKQPAVMIFYAKTRLRHRGYVERHEITGPNGGDVRLSGNLTLEQAQQELPPTAIEEIIKKVIGGSGNAAQALEKLKVRNL